MILQSVLCVLALAPPSAGKDSYLDETLNWRAHREAELKAEEGWLSVSGLFWLKEGDTTMGTDPSSGIVLPAGSVPGNVGTVTLHNGAVTFAAAADAQVTVKGQPVQTVDLRSDASGGAVHARVGSLTFMVIQRGKRVGIRLFDSDCPNRKGFTGEKWYLVDGGYRIDATFVAYPKPKQIPITNVLGDTAMVTSPGYVVFSLGGKKNKLEAEAEGSGLFINFRDVTSGHDTYPAGRFLYTVAPRDGHVMLDFNRATNPPCAFTDFATCPLPPRNNHLSIPVEAGEKVYPRDHAGDHAGN